MKQSDWLRKKFQDQQAMGYCKDHGESGVFVFFRKELSIIGKIFYKCIQLDKRTGLENLKHKIKIQYKAGVS